MKSHILSTASSFLLATSTLLTVGTAQAAPPEDRGNTGRTALTADLAPVPVNVGEEDPIVFAGRGDAQYNTLKSQGNGLGVKTVFNANARFSLDALQNQTYLGLTDEDAAEDAKVILLVGRDVAGDGCDPGDVYAMCPLQFSGIEVNDAGVLHASYKLALRTNPTGKLKGQSACFEFDAQTGAVGDEIMPDIEAGDSSGVMVNDIGPVLFGHYGE